MPNRPYPRPQRLRSTIFPLLVLLSLIASLLPPPAIAVRASARRAAPAATGLPILAAAAPVTSAARPQLPRGISGIAAFLSADTADDLTITWMSDRAYRFRIAYGTTRTLGRTAPVSALESTAFAAGGFAHTLTLPGSAAARYYRITALDPATGRTIGRSPVQQVGRSVARPVDKAATAAHEMHSHAQHTVQSIGPAATLFSSPGLDSSQVYCEFGGIGMGSLVNPRDCNDIAGTLPGAPSSGWPDLFSAGDPVALGDGAWYTRIPCLSIGGAGLPINVGLRYSSHMWFDSIGMNSIGRGWTVGYGRRLTFTNLTVDYFTPAPTLMLTLETGERWPFYDAGNGTYTSGAGNYTKLTRNLTTGEYTLTYRNGMKDLFGTDGLLKQVEDRFGNQTTISFNSTTGVQTLTNNRTKQSIVLEHEQVAASGTWRLVRIKDGPTNGGTARQITLGYNTSGQLYRVVDAAGRVYTFGYEAVTNPATARITSYYDPMNDPATVTGAKATTIQYRGDIYAHRVNRQVLANGTTIDFPFVSYGTTSRMDVIYNQGLPDERRQYFIGSTRSNSGMAGRILEYTLPGSTKLYKMGYDSQGNMTSLTDPLDRKTEYRYDTDGDLREVLGYKDATTYDLSLIDHNSFGQPISAQEPAGAVTRWSYNATTGALETIVREVSGASQTTRLSYEPVTIKGTAVQAGLVTKITLPDSTVNTQSYDSLGYPATTTYDAGTGRLALTEKTSYDWRGFLLSRTNLQGISTSYEYATTTGNYGNLGWASAEVFDTATDGRAIRTEYTYDRLGNVTQRVEDKGIAPRLNATWKYEYKPIGTEGFSGVTRVTDPLNQITTYEYTTYGELKKTVEVSQNNRTTSFEYLPQGWLSKTTLSDARVAETRGYNDAGQVTSVVDARGVKIEYGYDGKGRLSSAKLGSVAIGTLPAINASYTYGYDANDRLTSIVDPLSYTTVQRQYDAYNRLAWEKDGVGNQTSYSYDANRNWLTLKTIGSNNTAEQLQTQYSYDALGRMTQQIVDPGTGRKNLTTRYRYTTAGSSDPWNLQELQEPRTDRTAITRHSYNSLGLLATTTDALGSTWRYSYNNLGYLTGSTDALSRSTSYQPDLLGQVLGETINGKSVGWSYNADGTLRSATDQGGRVTEYSYDSTGRLASIDYTPLSSTGDDTTFSYTANDLLSSMQDSLGTTTYGYDALNRMTGRTRDSRTVGYTYQTNSRLSKISYWGRSEVGYGYDGAGRVTSLGPWGTSPTTYSYRSTSLLSVAQRAPSHSVRSDYSYDTASRLTGINHSRIGTSYQRSQYTLDEAGNRTSMTDNLGTASYSYDALDRLTSVTYPAIAGGPNTSTINYGYDPTGNRTSTTETSPGVQPSAVSGLSVWFKADAGVTSDSSGAISGWTNQANTATSASQITAANRPRLVGAAANGKPAVRFDGVDDTLSTNITGGGTAEQTIIVVAKGQTYQSMVRYQNASASYIVYPWGTDKNYIISSDSGGVGISSGLVENEWNIGIARYKPGTTGGMQTFRNGKLVAQRNSGSATLPSAPLTIGSYLGSSEFSKADVAEILVYNRALTESERQGVEQYLSQKYSVTVGGGRPARNNLALYKPARQSSTYTGSAGGDAARAVDSDTNGGYLIGSVTHTNSEVQPWWEVDLGAVNTIQTIDIWNRTDCCGDRLSNFAVLVSDTPFSGTTLDASRNQVGVSSFNVAGQAGSPTSVAVNRTGRYVRVQLAGTSVLSLAEVQVWGTRGAPTESVWVDDTLPAGAIASGTWDWISASPPPFSGTRAHQEPLASGMHQHFFDGATATLTPATGETLFAYVYLDPSAPPTEVMLQWNDGTWDHRAYWGANAIGFGVDGTDSRRYMGVLPAVGRWVRLEVPANLVGLENRAIKGMAFTLNDGRATWDKAGKALPSDNMTSFSYDANDRQTNGGVAYDTAGNLARDASGTTYTYDTANRLVKTVGASGTNEYFYDGLGNLIRQKINGDTTDFVLDESSGLPRVLGEIQSTNEIVYAYGPDGLHGQRKFFTAGGTELINYPLLDGQGTVRTITDAYAGIVRNTSYDVWGNLRYTNGIVPRFGLGYTGEQQTGDGLVYLRARHYAPHLGRFLQRDTFPGFKTSPQSLNRYSYVENNPANLTDPTGHCPLCAAVGAGALRAAGVAAGIIAGDMMTAPRSIAPAPGECFGPEPFNPLGELGALGVDLLADGSPLLLDKTVGRAVANGVGDGLSSVRHVPQFASPSWGAFDPVKRMSSAGTGGGAGNAGAGSPNMDWDEIRRMAREVHGQVTPQPKQRRAGAPIQRRPKFDKGKFDEVVEHMGGDASCAYCGGPAESIDHLFDPWVNIRDTSATRGEQIDRFNDVNNAVPACIPCNSAKQDRSLAGHVQRRTQQGKSSTGYEP